MLSPNLRRMFPTKPSQTTTSTRPAKTSRPSTLPTKLMCASLRAARTPRSTISVPLLRLLADVEQTHPRGRDFEMTLGEDRSHDAELEEILGRAGGIRADVEDHYPPLRRRVEHRDRGPRYAVETAERHERTRDDGAGVSRAHDAVHGPLLEHLQGDADRRVLFLADRVGRRLGHLHRLGRVNDLDVSRDGPRSVPRTASILGWSPTRTTPKSVGVSPRRFHRRRAL